MNNRRNGPIGVVSLLIAVVAALAVGLGIGLINHENRITRLEDWFSSVEAFNADPDRLLDGTDANTPWLNTPGRAPVDTTTDPFTPGSLSGATFAEMSERYGNLYGWADVLRIGRANPWYARAFDTYQSQLGFNWSDVERWGSDPALANEHQLAIVLLGGSNVTESQARAAVARALPGIGDLSNLPVVRRTENVMNTMSPSAETIRVFADGRAQGAANARPYGRARWPSGA